MISCFSATCGEHTLALPDGLGDLPVVNEGLPGTLESFGSDRLPHEGRPRPLKWDRPVLLQAFSLLCVKLNE